MLGRLTFTNKKEGNTNAGALVFDLQSNVINSFYFFIFLIKYLGDFEKIC